MNSKYLVTFLPLLLLLLLLLSSNYYIYAYDSKTLIYGGTNSDHGYSITSDGINLYITGDTSSEGSGNSDVLVMKLDNNLNLISKKIYGGPNIDRGNSITSDGTNLYITGYTYSEGSGSPDVLVMKLDNNLNLISKKIYGGTNGDSGNSITNDGTNLYITGYTSSEGSGSPDVLVMKLDNNLNLISKKIYGGTIADYGNSITSDGTNLYITGDTISEGSGYLDVLVMKLDNNLNLISKKIYGGTNYEYGNSITNDGTNLYITGYTSSEGSGSSNVLVIKLDNNLNLISKKIYGGPNADSGSSITSDGTNLYVTGNTNSEGSGSEDVLVMKLDNNLNLISKKIYGGPSTDYGNSITSDGTNLYITGFTSSEGSGSYDVLVWGLSKDLDSYVNTTNTSFNYLNSNLVYSDSNLVFGDSNLVFGDSNLIFQDSNLTGNMNYQNSNLNFSYFVLNSTQVSTSKPSNIFPFSCDKNYLMVLLGLVLYLIVS